MTALGVKVDPKPENRTAHQWSLCRMQLTLQLRGIATSVAVSCAASGFCICFFQPQPSLAPGAPPDEEAPQHPKLPQFSTPGVFYEKFCPVGLVSGSSFQPGHSSGKLNPLALGPRVNLFPLPKIRNKNLQHHLSLKRLNPNPTV